MPIYRSDVVGSLLRPAYLVEAGRGAESGHLDAAAFKRLEDRAVDEAIDLQEAAGLAVVTDGEMRRYAFFGHLIEALDGFDKLGGWAIPFRNEQGEQLVFKRPDQRSEEHTSELQSQSNLVCRLLLEKKKTRSVICHLPHD